MISLAATVGASGSSESDWSMFLWWSLIVKGLSRLVWMNGGGDSDRSFLWWSLTTEALNQLVVGKKWWSDCNRLATLGGVNL